MSARRFAVLASFAFLLMFVAANVIANSWLRSWRLDLTQAHLYTLSQGTQETLDHLSDSIELTFYYSRDAAAHRPDVQAYAGRVREMLQTFAAHSHGRVRLVEVNVKPFSPEEDRAQEAGIQPVRPDQNEDPIYFGLVGANAIDDKRVVPFFDPAREPFLEYEITRLIYELEHPDRTRVDLITSLPIDPANAVGAQGQPTGQSVFATEMGRLMDVHKIAQDFTELPDADVLAIIHPWALSPAQLYAVDQFILRRGRAFIALDPASLMASQGASGPFGPAPGTAPTASSLEPLMSRWGVAVSQDVVLDLEGALPVQTQDANGQTTQAPQPLFFSVPADQLDRHDLMTAWLNRGINFGLAGALSWSPHGDGLEEETLAHTSGRTMRMPAAEAMARPSPYEILQNWPSTGRVETLALRLSGPLQTAFPNGPPEGAPPPPQGQQRLTRSLHPAQLVIVSDADFLADDFYIDPRNGGPAADNASFALNAIDVLGGSDALVSLRSRAPSLRRMTVIDDMERDAQRLIEQRQQDLQGQLEDTLRRLQEAESRGRGSGFFTGNLGAELTPEENREVARAQQQVHEVRAELRGVERDLRSGLNTLKAWIVFVNVWLAPLLVAAIGLVLFWRRQRRAQGAPR
jgi:ABC-type uncharacterized transport system involved in gliding motility auxiliary subunit